MILKIVNMLVYLIKHPMREYKRRKLYSSFCKIGNNVDISQPDILTYPENISIGSNTVILNHARLQSFPYLTKQKSKIIIGSDCHIGYYLTILCGADITIDNGVLIASNVLISSEEHGINPESGIYYMDQPLDCSPIEIGEGSWIGEKVVILSGVIIGKKCIIGASSVVTHSIPDYSIAVGSPAKVVKTYNFITHEWERIV